jgi:hypothetical protein
MHNLSLAFDLHIFTKSYVNHVYIIWLDNTDDTLDNIQISRKGFSETPISLEDSEAFHSAKSNMI